MSKIFKPKFRISKFYRQASPTHDGENPYNDGFLVSIRYWWWPLWASAWIPGTFLIAKFKTEDEAIDYIKRRYNTITADTYVEED